MNIPDEPAKFRVDMLLETLLAIVRERSLEGVFESCRTYFNQRPHAAALGVWLGSNDDQALSLKWSESRTCSSPYTWSNGEEDFDSLSFSDSFIGTAASNSVPVQFYGGEWDRPEWAKKENIHSCLALPMHFKGALIGVLGVFFYPRFDEGFQESAKWLGVLADYLAAAISNAQAYESIDQLTKQLAQENDYLREEVRRVASYDQIIGQSEALLRILEQIEMVAPTDANVLILGESGTGKELISRAIHDRSHRSDKPFVKVNCAAVPHGLFESEFFGHAKGAFSGALKDRVGRFQLADGGTLMLDEVGEIPLDLQSKLLRVLQEEEFEVVGGDQTRKVSVRVIAVTNRDLRQEADAGRFRHDLYYRLSVFPIEVPPLRDRKVDIPLLVHHFVHEAVFRLGLPKPVIDSEAIQMLEALDWEGNIRELKNAVERAVISAGGKDMDFGFLQCDPILTGKDSKAVMPKIIKEEEWRSLQRSNILNALEVADWKIQGDGGAAELLGMKPTTLRSRVQAMGIKKTRGG